MNMDAGGGGMNPAGMMTGMMMGGAMGGQMAGMMNDFVKPKDQREFIRFGLARIFVQASAIERLLILPSAAENVKRKSHF